VHIQCLIGEGMCIMTMTEHGCFPQAIRMQVDPASFHMQSSAGFRLVSKLFHPQSFLYSMTLCTAIALWQGLCI